MQEVQKRRSTKILYHIGQRPAAPKPKQGSRTDYASIPNDASDEDWAQSDRKYRVPVIGWERPWFKENMASAVFMSDNPYQVWSHHGVSGNVYIYEVPIPAIKEAGGIHKYQDANEIVFSEEVWNKWKDEIKLLGRIHKDAFQDIVDRTNAFTYSKMASFQSTRKSRYTADWWGTEEQWANNKRRHTQTMWQNLSKNPRMKEIVKLLTKDEKLKYLESIEKFIEAERDTMYNHASGVERSADVLARIRELKRVLREY